MSLLFSRMLPAFGLLLICPAILLSQAPPHGKGSLPNQAPPRGKVASPAAADVGFAYECPKCSQRIPGPEEPPPSKCPHCGVSILASRVDGGYELKWIEVSDNRWRQPLFIAAGVLVFLAVTAYAVRALRSTAAATPPAKRKRKD